MSANTAVWLAVALTSAVVITLIATHLRRRATKANPTPWLLAAVVSATMLVFTAAKVTDLARVTAVDVAVLAITGILTGLFLGFALTPRQPHQGRNNPA
jgi:uncharacterized membrane protein YoaK (UPF0700 family)